MEIVWLGHSSVRLQSKTVTLITDPYADSLGFSMGNPTADIVIISNDHPHHSNSDAIGGSPRILRGPGEYEIADFYIKGTGTPRWPTSVDRQVNTVFTMWAEGLSMCHLGDLNQALSSKQVENLRQIDVLFVPAGGTCTLGPADVGKLVNLIAPRLVIPLHYAADGVEVDLEPLDPFLAELGVSNVVHQAKLVITSANVPQEQRVVILQRTA